MFSLFCSRSPVLHNIVTVRDIYLEICKFCNDFHKSSRCIKPTDLAFAEQSPPISYSQTELSPAHTNLIMDDGDNRSNYPESVGLQLASKLSYSIHSASASE